MPRGGKREGAGRPPRLLLELDSLDARRLLQLAERAGLTPEQYISVALLHLSVQAESGDVIVLASTPPTPCKP